MTRNAQEGASPRVMLVDDDRDLVDIIRMVLEERGYRVSCAYDPVAGMRTIERERPDLLVLDVMMPEASEGFHMVWQLRSRDDAYFRNVPIIMLTAVHQRTPLRFYPDVSDGTYAAGEYLPVEDFIDKPVDPAVLLATVERVLDTTRLHPAG